MTNTKNKAESAKAQISRDKQMLIETIEWIECKFPNEKSTASEFAEISKQLREIDKRVAE